MRKLFLVLVVCIISAATFAQTANDSIVTITVNGVSFNMVKVKGGTFVMGTDSCGVTMSPAHKVTLSDYYIGQIEVTQALWIAVDEYLPIEVEQKNNELPVTYLNWTMCKKFVKSLSEMTGRKFAIPTEAQWEYAARGGAYSKNYLYAGSDSLDLVAYYVSSKNKDEGCGLRKPNELGIYDMSGSVWEWCSDWYGLYSAEEETDPAGAPSGQYKVLRGGAYASGVFSMRTVARYIDNSSSNRYDYGLRIVMLP